MLIGKGEKIHVVYRRIYEGAATRHFIGEVLEAEGPVVRAEGHVYVLDSFENRYKRKPEKRTTLLNLAESGYVVNLIPADVDLSKLVYRPNDQKYMVVTDGAGFSLDINEFGARR